MATNFLRIRKIILFLLKSFLVVLLVVFAIFSSWFFLNTKTLLFVDYEPSELLLESISQKGEKVAFYLRRRAMTSDSVLGVYQKGDKIKKIIFLYPTSNVSVKWLDEEHLAFSWTNYRTNETYHKSINIHNETYDWRDYPQN